jgi:hypothetical protein
MLFFVLYAPYLIYPFAATRSGIEKALDSPSEPVVLKLAQPSLNFLIVHFSLVDIDPIRKL